MTPPLAMMPAAMERPTFNSLLQGLPVLGRAGDGSVRISSLVTDSRRIIPGSLFFALPGLRSNGHAFLDDAIAREAGAKFYAAFLIVNRQRCARQRCINDQSYCVGANINDGLTHRLHLCRMRRSVGTFLSSASAPPRPDNDALVMK